MQAFIGPVRNAIRELLRREGTLPVYGYLPDDVAHLPVYVVGRPSLIPTETAVVMDLELDVAVLGRRIADEDAQAELDAYADELFDVLGGTVGTKLDDRLLECTSVRPGSVVVAALEIPVYTFTITYPIATC